MSLSYQHMYHAGNRADLHKHMWLIAIMDALRAHPSPITWIDAHAGRGLYDLESEAADKTKEYLHGIMQAWHEPMLNDPLWMRLRQLQLKVNPTRGTLPHLRYYAGSSLLAAMLLRAQDKLMLAELHPAEFAALRTTMQGYAHAQLHHEDMGLMLHRLLPLHQTQGGILLDPSYERKEDYVTFPSLMHKIARQWQEGIIMLWYPILPAARHETMRGTCSDLLSDVLIDEWMFPEPEDGKRRGLLGSGMMIYRAPTGAATMMNATKQQWIDQGFIALHHT